MTITCPSCNHEELEGALFCSECGAKLAADGMKTKEIETKGKRTASSKPKTAPFETPKAVTEALISLHVVRTGQILPLVGREEFTIGRVSEGQSILPDIDLTPYEAYMQGVSRLHATIRKEGKKISVSDLGSSNGTRVNNEKLDPHKKHRLNHGDVIALGQFKIQALIRKD